MFNWLFKRKATVIINDKKVVINWDCRQYKKQQVIDLTKQQLELGTL